MSSTVHLDNERKIVISKDSSYGVTIDITFSHIDRKSSYYLSEEEASLLSHALLVELEEEKESGEEE